MSAFNNLFPGLSILGISSILLLFLEMDRYLGTRMMAFGRTRVVVIGLLATAVALLGMALVAGTWSPILVGAAVTSALGGTTLQLGLIRRQDVARQVVFHTTLSSPGTSFRRENVNARWEEHRDRLVFFIREEDWKQIAASTPETRRGFERFFIAPGLYSAPSDNEVLQLVDSLQLYQYLLSPDHKIAVSTFQKLLKGSPPSLAPDPSPEPVTSKAVADSLPSAIVQEPPPTKESMPSQNHKKRKKLPSPSITKDDSQLELGPPTPNIRSS